MRRARQTGVCALPGPCEATTMSTTMITARHICPLTAHSFIAIGDTGDAERVDPCRHWRARRDGRTRVVEQQGCAQPGPRYANVYRLRPNAHMVQHSIPVRNPFDKHKMAMFLVGGAGSLATPATPWTFRETGGRPTDSRPALGDGGPQLTVDTARHTIGLQPIPGCCQYPAGKQAGHALVATLAFG